MASLRGDALARCLAWAAPFQMSSLEETLLGKVPAWQPCQPGGEAGAQGLTCPFLQLLPPGHAAAADSGYPEGVALEGMRSEHPVRQCQDHLGPGAAAGLQPAPKLTREGEGKGVGRG